MLQSSQDSAALFLLHGSARLRITLLCLLPLRGIKAIIMFKRHLFKFATRHAFSDFYEPTVSQMFRCEYDADTGIHVKIIHALCWNVRFRTSPKTHLLLSPHLPEPYPSSQQSLEISPLQLLYGNSWLGTPKAGVIILSTIIGQAKL